MTDRIACSLTSLSIELIWHIIDLLPPESHLDFACTCKRIANCSKDVLNRHQEAYTKYSVASDILPGTIPTLLRSAFGRADPILIWHVRSLEIWYDRLSWTDWKLLSFDQPLQEGSYINDRLAWKWQDDEVEEYIEDLEDQFEAMFQDGDEDIHVDAREQFEDGLDGILKMLLICYCPRLRTVKLVPQECHEKTTLGWLRRVIQGSIVHGSHWPPGLCSIQEMSVGVESETWISRPPTADDLDPYRTSMHVFSTLLRLPRLDSIYYNNLLSPDEYEGDEDETDFEEDPLMSWHSSRVKHIFLDDCSDMPHSFRNAITQAFTALETFTLRAGPFSGRIENADSLVAGLCQNNSASLHTLMFYGPFNHHQIHGYRCSCYRPDELRDARHLHTVAIDISDVELDCIYAMDDDFDKLTEPEQRKRFIEWFCETAFPSSLETLVFWGDIGYYSLTKSADKLLDWYEDALIHVVESHRWKYESDSADEEGDDEQSTDKEVFYGDLKAVYLEEIEKKYRDARHRKGGPFTERLYFQKLIEAGKKAGIDIYTLTNRVPPQHTHSFPRAPEKYDLQTGPWWGHRDETKEWVFDVYQGRRVPPHCGKCGTCEKCLNWYNAELWESLDV